MNFFMGKKFVGPGGKSGKDGPEVVIDNGADNKDVYKRQLQDGLKVNTISLPSI